MVLVTSWKEGQQEVTPTHAVNSQRVANEEKGWEEMEFSVVFGFHVSEGEVWKYQQVEEAEWQEGRMNPGEKRAHARSPITRLPPSPITRLPPSPSLVSRLLPSLVSRLLPSLVSRLLHHSSPASWFPGSAGS